MYGLSEETNNLKLENQAENFEVSSSHWNRLDSGNNISCFLNIHIYIFNKTRASGANGKYRSVIGKYYKSSTLLPF